MMFRPHYYQIFCIEYIKVKIPGRNWLIVDTYCVYVMRKPTNMKFVNRR